MTGRRGSEVQGIILDYFLRPALAKRDEKEREKQRHIIRENKREEGEMVETWYMWNSIRRINHAEDPRGARRTAGRRNLISLANEFLSKSRVSHLT